MDEQHTRTSCQDCGCETDCCAFCDEAECPRAICYRCLSVALRQRISDAHTHGG